MMELWAEAAHVRAQADCVQSVDAVQAAYDRMAQAIAAQYADAHPLLLCVMVGGLVPTAELIRRFDFPFELDYLHATRYRGNTQGAELVWKARPETPVRNRHVLVIDDILDEGHTLAAIQTALRAQAPASLRTAVLAVKDHQRRAPEARAEYVGLHVPDRYVFGCGMDYKGFFRGLPAIYAVKA